jgi:hypothetical protein
MAEIEETPQVQTAAGAGSNGNTDGVDDAAGSEVSRQPQTEEKLWTQAEVEKLIQERLTTAEQRQAKKRDDAARHGWLRSSGRTSFSSVCPPTRKEVDSHAL